MREYGIPKVLTWRWAPFAALVLGALSFVAFTLLAIPEHIGHVEGETTTDRFSLANRFNRNQPGAAPAGDWSKQNAEPGVATPSPVTRVATQTTDMFPKRGFSPPLERSEPPAPPPPAVIPAQPQPVLATAPPEPPPPAPPAPEVAQTLSKLGGNMPLPSQPADVPAAPPPDAAGAVPPPAPPPN